LQIPAADPILHKDQQANAKYAKVAHRHIWKELTNLAMRQGVFAGSSQGSSQTPQKLLLKTRQAGYFLADVFWNHRVVAHTGFNLLGSLKSVAIRQITPQAA
jgi:hypothetical protein